MHEIFPKFLFSPRRHTRFTRCGLHSSGGGERVIFFGLGCRLVLAVSFYQKAGESPARTLPKTKRRAAYLTLSEFATPPAERGVGSAHVCMMSHPVEVDFCFLASFFGRGPFPSLKGAPQIRDMTCAPRSVVGQAPLALTFSALNALVLHHLGCMRFCSRF